MPTLFGLFLLIVLVIVALMIRRMFNRKMTIGGGLRELSIQEPWYTEIVEGRKTVEGRAGARDSAPRVGENIIISNLRGKSARAKVTDVRHYATLAEYIEAEGWQRIAPHTGSNAAAANAYAAIVKKDQERVFSPERVAAKGGVNAIELAI